MRGDMLVKGGMLMREDVNEEYVNEGGMLVRRVY